MNDIALTTNQALELYERGYTLVAIASKLGQHVAVLQKNLNDAHGAKRMQEAVTRNIEASMEHALDEIDRCVDKDQAVELAAKKTKLEFRKWQASMVSNKYKPAQEKGPVGGGLTINIIGMSGAALRNPNVIDV